MQKSSEMGLFDRLLPRKGKSGAFGGLATPFRGLRLRFGSACADRGNAAAAPVENPWSGAFPPRSGRCWLAGVYETGID